MKICQKKYAIDEKLISDVESENGKRKQKDTMFACL